MKLKQAKWLGKGHYATDENGNIYYRYDENDQRPIKLEKKREYGRGSSQFKYIGNSVVVERSNYYYSVTIGKADKAVHVIIARNYPEICGEWFEGAVVHHINGLKHDNRPENLQVMTPEEHTKWHFKTKINYNGEEYASFAEATRKTQTPYWEIIANKNLIIFVDDLPFLLTELHSYQQGA